MNLLDKTVAELHASVTELEKQLVSVLLPRAPMPVEKNAEEVSTMAPLARELFMLTCRVREVVRTLDIIHRNLDLPS